MPISAGAEDSAQIRHRNHLFDIEAKAAGRLLDQVRQYVGRAQVCQASDFEDLCTIHHSINDLFDRVKRFSNSESLPRVYGHVGVRAVSRGSGSENARTPDNSYGKAHQLPLPGSDSLEELDAAQNAEDAGARAPLSDLLRSVPDVSMEELCRGVQVSTFLGPKTRGVQKSPSRPASSPKGTPRRKLKHQGTLVPKVPVSPERTSRPVSGSQKPVIPTGPSSELLIEVFMEWTGGNVPTGQVLQELSLEMQVVELPARTPMRSLRITNQPGSLGTVTMEVHSLKRAELCMAVVKEFQTAGWDQTGDLSMLSPGGNIEGTNNSDVSSALRVPVSQLLSACSSGASLEWEADAARTIVVQGKMMRAGMALEYFPGNLQAVPESHHEIVAGRGAAAAGALRSTEAPVALQGSKHYQAAAGRGEGFSAPPSEMQLNFYAKLSDAEAVLPPSPLASRPVTAPHPPASQPPQRKPRPGYKPTPEEESSAVSRYVSRLLLRGSNTLRKKAESIRSNSRGMPARDGSLIRDF